MKKELPVRHWKTLPETELITSLIDEAPDRLQDFYDSQKPAAISDIRILPLPELRQALMGCRACDICPKATAPVMGEGPADARIMFVGEQPGNEEDLQGRPFIGPAGQLLDKAMKELGFNREKIYVTNAVKGFKWLPQMSQRWHRTANGSEISACKPWLKQEVANIQPEILVCLGRTAAQSVIGKMIKLEDVRGKFFKTAFADKTIVLPHPASILRADPQMQESLFERFKLELKIIQEAV
jgi:DNA polymerase